MAIDNRDIYARTGVIYRPQPIVSDENGEPHWKAGRYNGFYEVIHGDRMVLAYHVWFFRSPGQVLKDLLRLMDLGEQGPLEMGCDADYTIWRDGRIVGLVRHPMNHEEDSDEPDRVVMSFKDSQTPEELVDGLEDENGDLPEWLTHEWPDREQWLSDNDLL